MGSMCRIWMYNLRSESSGINCKLKDRMDVVRAVDVCFSVHTHVDSDIKASYLAEP